jgi:integration host factor subunit beta
MEGNPTLSQRDVENFVSTFFETIVAHLVANGRVDLRGFGAFYTGTRVAHAGYNPRTGDPTEVPAKREPRFRASRVLRLQPIIGG